MPSALPLSPTHFFHALLEREHKRVGEGLAAVPIMAAGLQAQDPVLGQRTALGRPAGHDLMEDPAQHRTHKSVIFIHLLR